MLKQHQNKEAYPPTILLELHPNIIRSQSVSYLVQQYAVKQTAISNYSQNPLELLQQTIMHCKRSLFASHTITVFISSSISNQKFKNLHKNIMVSKAPNTKEFNLALSLSCLFLYFHISILTIFN